MEREHLGVLALIAVYVRPSGAHVKLAGGAGLDRVDIVFLKIFDILVNVHIVFVTGFDA